MVITTYNQRNFETLYDITTEIFNSLLVQRGICEIELDDERGVCCATVRVKFDRVYGPGAFFEAAVDAIAEYKYLIRIPLTRTPVEEESLW